MPPQIPEPVPVEPGPARLAPVEVPRPIDDMPPQIPQPVPVEPGPAMLAPAEVPRPIDGTRVEVLRRYPTRGRISLDHTLRIEEREQCNASALMY